MTSCSIDYGKCQVVKVIHRKCGTQVGWYLRDAPREPDVVRSKDFMRMDGSQPAFGSVRAEFCPKCNRKIDGDELKRLFRESEEVI